MAWLNVWDGLKNKTCRYLLQRYLGQFLEEKLNLEQLKVELYNGKATVKNVSLKVDALNDLFEAQGWAVEVLRGHIGVLTVTVPWNALMTNDSAIEVSDVFITLRPIKRQNDGTSMLESMWSSVSSTMQLAAECMNQNDETSDGFLEMQTNSIVGLEKFAETIDNVMNRIKASFTNINIKVEYPATESTGIAVMLNIQDLYYQNETGRKTGLGLETKSTKSDLEQTENCNVSEDMHVLPTFANHNIIINGARLFTEEFDLMHYNPHEIPDIFSGNVTHNMRTINMNKGFAQENDGKLIPILELKGKQKILIKVKQSEKTNGPKVCLDMELGSIFTFLSPRQVHLLIKLYGAFSERDRASKYEMKGIGTKKNKYFEDSKTYKTGILGTQNSWAGDVDEILENTYTPSTGLKSDICCDSLSSSVTSNSTTTETGTSRLVRKLTNMDSCGEILSFNLRIAFIKSILLHEDIVEDSKMKIEIPLYENMQLDMLNTANLYFDGLNEYKEYIVPNILYDRNHIFLSMATVVVDGIQQRNRSVLLLKTSGTVAKIDFDEVLDGIKSPLVAFDRIENNADGYQKRPELILTLKSTSTCNSKEFTTTKIDITLEKSTFELDVSIYDRLSHLFAPSPFSIMFKNNINYINSGKAHDFKKYSTELNIISRLLDVKLRFPVSDESDECSWRKQNIRADFLLFTFYQLRFNCNSNIMDILSNEIDIFYYESDVHTGIHIIKGSLDNANCKNSPHELNYKYPRITIYNLCAESNQKSCSNYSESNGLQYNLKTNGRSANLPFRSKGVCRHTDASSRDGAEDESETILLPGNKDEINNFCDATMKSSNIQISVKVPVIDVIFESKQLYEIIYNRLNTDLFMWKPRSPELSNTPLSQVNNMDLMTSIYETTPEEKLFEKISYNNFNSTSTNEMKLNTESIFTDKSHSSFTESVYFSMHESGRMKILEDKFNLKTSSCSVEVFIERGSLTLFSPVRDKENLILPSQLGKFQFKINCLKLFLVNAYNNNNDLDYICLQLKDLELYHCGLLPSDMLIPLQLGDCKEQVLDYMKSTFYKLRDGLTKGNMNTNNDREMISLVIEIKRLPLQKVKRIRLTTGIQGATLRYHPSLPAQTWINQLIDFLDICDYPIEGYVPFGVLTEIQLHCWECAIDYRPSNFPYRTVIEIGAFGISSNIISSVRGCNLRFILEECVISIAPYNCEEKEHPDCKVTYLQSNGLVPLLDIGLLDISLRLNDKAADKYPQMDLRCSVHDVHLRTCSDSGSVLAEFITYIATDGHYRNSSNNDIQKSHVYSDSENLLSDCVNEHSEITVKQQERVNLLMAEAVQDTITCSDFLTNSMKLPHRSQSVEMFYFPDEGRNKPICNSREIETTNELCDILNFESNVTSYYINESDETLPQIKADLGDVNEKCSTPKEPSILQDDDYCIIANDSIKNICGIKNIQISEDPLRIVDNHFCIPDEKPDLLKPPESFPTAVNRYTLCEMNFTWHLYGGKDFPNSLTTVPESNKRAEKSHMSEAYKHGVSYSKGAQGIQFAKKPKEKLTWKSIGGSDRNHEILVEMQFSKVRFSYEQYPIYTSEASRQVLLIGEIEVRDRLQTSDINKFLYHPTKGLSNKNPQHMVVIKALHIRPNPKQSSAQECSLRISLLPMRLHIDQDTLVFLGEYFSSIGDSNKTDSNESKGDTVSLKSTPIQTHAPIMLIDEVPEAVQDLRTRRMVATNLDLLMDDTSSTKQENKPNASSELPHDQSPIYFREVIFSPEVPICFDYHGHRVELSRGPITGLLMGLGQLQCSEIRLKKLVYRRGLLGLEKLLTYFCKEWLKDIKRNQLPKILSGVGPTYAFVQLFQGLYDLFWLPIEQYQRDGRLIRGIQLGAQSFTARTALAALEITARVVQLLQFTAETAFDMVSPGPSVRRTRKTQRGKKKRPHRPRDIREGVTNAYILMKEGFNSSANALIETAVSEHDQKGYTGAVGAVMRQIPQLVVCPAVLATQATTNILGGVKSSLVPESKIEAREKWKDDSD